MNQWFRLRVCLWACCWLAAILPAWARGTMHPVYTLEDCLRIGLERASVLRNARRDSEIAETTIGEVGAQIRPQLSARASYTRLDARQQVTVGEQSLALGALDNYAAGFSARQLLYAGGSVRAALRAARDYRDLEAHRLDQVRAELIRDIHAGFADLLLLEATVEVHEKTVAQLADVVEQTQRRFDREQVAEFDLLNARVQLHNAMPDLVRARHDLNVAKAAFRNLVRLDSTDFAIDGQLQEAAAAVSLDGSLQRARLHRPELLALERLASLREADIRAEQGRYLPELSLTADYSGENPADMFADADRWEWRWRAGLQVSWNWLDGGLRRHLVRRKRLERDKALESLDEARRAVELDVRKAYLRVVHAGEAVGASRENVALAGKSLEIARTRYETGLTTRLEFNDVNLALKRARLNALRALRDQRQALNDLAFAVGDYVEQGKQ